jgi:hypothetical protein
VSDLHTRIPAAIRDGAGNRRQVALALGLDPVDERFRAAWESLHLDAVIGYTPGCCPVDQWVHGDSCEVELLDRVATR